MGLGIAILVSGTPDAELADATLVEVHERTGAATAFLLHYTVDISQGDLPLLKDARLDPGSPISVIAQSGAEQVCLVNGLVFGQQIQLAHGGAGSRLEVRGADRSTALDRDDKAVLWADMSDGDAVSAILAQHSLAADLEPTPALHGEPKHTLVQRETDLAFIRRLARRNGFLFWLTCDVDGVETAHFKRPPLGEPVAELVINLTEPPANLASLEITWDIERPTGTTATQVDLNTKSDLDGTVARSPLNALGAKGLADLAPEPRTLHLAAPVDDAGDLRARGEGALIEAGFFLCARGQTTLHALGKVLRAHTVVNLRGAGARHSGKWFCAAVRHVIDAAEHRMEFELLRNGWEA